MEDLPWGEIKEASPAVHALEFQLPRRRTTITGWEQWVLLRSDAHHDSRYCRQDQEKADLDEAVARHAPIIDGGDLFCAMQGKWDPRADQAQLRPEHQTNDYLDTLVRTAADFYEPYAHHFVLLCPGNHETSILKRHQTNLTQRLAQVLNDRVSSNIRCGTYAGWLRIRVCFNRRSSLTLSIYRHHGYGGGGPVTRGIIQTNRMAVYLPDADIVWTGHTHDSWKVPIARERLPPRKDRPYRDTQTHIRTPGYKDEYAPKEGWHIERGGAPKPTGACWLRLYAHRRCKLAYELLETAP